MRFFGRVSVCGSVQTDLRSVASSATSADDSDARGDIDPSCATIRATSHDTGFAIGIGAAVDRVVDHPMDGRITWSRPHNIAVAANPAHAR